MIQNTSGQQMQAQQLDTFVGAESNYAFTQPLRLATLNREVARRQRCNDTETFSERYVTDVAAQRHFDLVHVELEGLRDYLNEIELRTLLNTTCSPVWSWDAYSTLAAAVADDFGIDELDANTEIGQFILKLSRLSRSQCVALVDTFERIWRDLGAGSDSLAASAERCGLQLRTDD